MNDSDADFDLNPQVIACRKTLLAIQKVLEETDLNHITSPGLEALIEGLQVTNTVFRQLREQTQESYRKQQMKSMQLLVQDTVRELQIAIYALDQRNELKITQRVESMRLVYKSMRSCSLYIEEILDMLSSYPT